MDSQQFLKVIPFLNKYIECNMNLIFLIFLSLILFNLRTKSLNECGISERYFIIFQTVGELYGRKMNLYPSDSSNSNDINDNDYIPISFNKFLVGAFSSLIIGYIFCFILIFLEFVNQFAN